ncbi:MAG TPA: hypothetical protein VF662_07620 [Allosphingosinicella sp.]
MKIRLRRPRSAPPAATPPVQQPPPEQIRWYVPRKVNRCPSCGESQWLVGRALAECGHCALALPIAR